jgi:hypothetical protein
MKKPAKGRFFCALSGEGWRARLSSATKSVQYAHLVSVFEDLSEKTNLAFFAKSYV